MHPFANSKVMQVTQRCSDASDARDASDASDASDAAMHWQCSFQAELLQSADGTSCARPGFHNCLKLHTDKQTDTETDTQTDTQTGPKKDTQTENQEESHTYLYKKRKKRVVQIENRKDKQTC